MAKSIQGLQHILRAAGTAPSARGNHRRRPFWRWMRPLLGALLALVVALVSSGLVYQAIATAYDRQAFPPPGLLVDVGGYRLHVQVLGADTGGPTVLLDHAWGSTSAQWGWVHGDVARVARVVAYDRPGQGYSDAPPAPLDAHAFAHDLHAALTQAGVHGPYVVVGHSMGSLTARAFAAMYPDEVVGAVLVDPRYVGIEAQMQAVFPEHGPVTGEPTWTERWLPSLAARLGIMRLVDPLGMYVDQLPPPSAGAARAVLASTHHWTGALPDALLGEHAADMLVHGEQLGAKPVVVLSAGAADSDAFPDPARARFTALHAQMAAVLSTKGEHRVIAGADHYTIVTQPDYAQRVAAAIQDVISSSTHEEP